jgi:hypothetical protein
MLFDATRVLIRLAAVYRPASLDGTIDMRGVVNTKMYFRELKE